jgi:DNA repair photolyase
MQSSTPVHGRGAPFNPANRFEELHLEADADADASLSAEDVLALQSAPKTKFFKDKTQSVLTHNDSPDVGFDTGINPYRGCEHGCIYCYARPTHEYLGFSAGLDFESKIMVKEDAPKLLRAELMSPKWKPRVVAMSGNTDCYQPVEKKLEITRKCLAVFAEFRNPVSIITKNHLVTRDIDLLQELAKHDATAVFISVTTLDSDLARVMEPRTSMPAQRIEAIRKLSSAGIPVGVMVGPTIPGLTDHEMLSIIERATDAGAKYAGFTVVRLPHAVKDLFEKWLEVHAPGKKDKVLNRIRSMRDGKLNDPNFGTRMRGYGIFAEQIDKTFEIACRKAGILGRGPSLSAAAFRRPGGAQMEFGL